MKTGMDIKKTFESRWFMRALMGLGVLLIALIVFQAGVYVGVRKAGMSFRMGDSYYRVVGQGPLPGDPFGEELSEAGGAAGRIVSVTLPTFLVASPDGDERFVVVTDRTMIRFMRDATSSSAITPDRSVIVIGAPDDKGRIQASFIRLLPPPPPGKAPHQQ